VGSRKNIMINPDNPNPNDNPRSSTEIEGDIRRTRGRMDATLDELGDRLTARSIVNSALDWWEKRTGGADSNARSKAKDAYRSVARQVKDHPMPALLIGAGIAWIIVDTAAADDEAEANDYPGSDRGRRYRASLRGTTATGYSATGLVHAFGEGDAGAESESGPGLGEKAADIAAQARDAVSDAADAVRNKMSGLGDAAHGALEQSRSVSRSVGRSLQSGYRAGADQIEDAMAEYPLAVGIGFAALGALTGLLLPRSRREDRMFGEQSDELVDAAKEKGKELLESGKAVAERVGEVALNEAQSQGLTAEAGADKVSELASKAGEIVRKAKDEAIAAAKDEGLSPGQTRGEAAP